jgi:P4 family phage/plasmid primase-like protien
MQFCKISLKTGQPYDVYDSRVADYIIANQSIMIIAGVTYLYRKSGVYQKDNKKGTLLSSLIESLIIKDLVTAQRIKKIRELILLKNQLQVDIEEVNLYPKTWVNFKNGMVDIETGEIHPHSPQYRSINQIPHNYRPNLDISKSVFNKFIQSRIPDEENQKMLYEFMGYCLLKEVVFLKFLVFCGTGDTGKSTIINFISNIVGKENLSNLPLQEMCSRFSPAYLLHKQLNACGDIPETAITDSSMIKQLFGDDEIKGEYKGGEIFFFKNTAKFLFSCNTFPLVVDEKTNGFYRRLMIIEFDNQGDFIPNLYERLREEEEIEIVISHVIEGVKSAFKRGKIYESGASLGAVSRLRKDSDSVAAFLDECIERKADGRIKRPDLYACYEQYCREEERIPLGKKGFFRDLRSKGIKETKNQGTMLFCGLSIKFTPCNNTPFN